MSAELFVDVTPEELTIALLEDKRLVELRKEKSNIQFQVGDIYLAKIKKIISFSYDGFFLVVFYACA